MSMNFKRLYTLRPLLVTSLRSENVLRKRLSPMNIQKSYNHDDTTAPFDSLPFKIKSKYSATLAFTFILGIGLWSPFFILWYSMAKRTL